MAKNREACGRCSMSVATEVANADRSAEERADRDPYGEHRIEVDEDQLRTFSPGAWLSGVSSRLDDAAQRVIWGR
ncbi:hypothetical protein [Natronorubrum texcoconense]|uniref:Uncharacterized protein n=1 Tax=Natronorubrum texcoconense TaxID=1095776 RepID=A0A1G8TQT1_9EURY|nr:hypothetical protein [Natronorubrum texcoconense]SDJ43891.1 hypothetical protein SAMN04515672_0565 [Natronorubrum texcoconense]